MQCRHYLLTPVLQPGNDQQNRYNNSAHVRNVAKLIFGPWKIWFPCLQ
ncbi:unnamed protein product [Diabrotica balteata]|uniref:Uncharacterized protein n=1 Tax=Diabrotica balteata TaxID=107213 RepID=A0A9N9SUN6_DIABA|nr:unnamed protein product [Diabrotica balteata]